MCDIKRKPKYQRRKKRATPRKVQKKRKTSRFKARAVKKNVLKIHASTEPMPPAKALSPLCVKLVQPSRPKDQVIEHSEITPEMIHQALRELTMRRDYVEFDQICNNILNHYPVNKNKKQLKAELNQKLHIALLAGMICSDCSGRNRGYRLCSSLEGLRQTPKAVVTLFWEMYFNFMDPLQIQPGKNIPVLDPNNENNDTDSDSPPDDNFVAGEEENTVTHI